MRYKIKHGIFVISPESIQKTVGRDKTFDEKLIMHYFREKYDGFPKGRLIKSESPDFVLRISPKRSIGIEITQLGNQAEEIKKLTDLIRHLKLRLSAKNEKLKNYQRKRYAEYWLIVYADQIELPGVNTLQEQLMKIILPGDFERVFLFELFDGKIFRIASGHEN